jgi:hypothetical protein
MFKFSACMEEERSKSAQFKVSAVARKDNVGFPDVLFMTTYTSLCGPGSVVGIATGYGLDGPGIESRWGTRFSALSRPALEPTQPPVQWIKGLSRG